MNLSPPADVEIAGRSLRWRYKYVAKEMIRIATATIAALSFQRVSVEAGMVRDNSFLISGTDLRRWAGFSSRQRVTIFSSGFEEMRFCEPTRAAVSIS